MKPSANIAYVSFCHSRVYLILNTCHKCVSIYRVRRSPTRFECLKNYVYYFRSLDIAFKWNHTETKFRTWTICSSWFFKFFIWNTIDWVCFLDKRMSLSHEILNLARRSVANSNSRKTYAHVIKIIMGIRVRK